MAHAPPKQFEYSAPPPGGSSSGGGGSGAVFTARRHQQPSYARSYSPTEPQPAARYQQPAEYQPTIPPKMQDISAGYDSDYDNVPKGSHINGVYLIGVHMLMCKRFVLEQQKRKCDKVPTNLISRWGLCAYSVKTTRSCE